MLPASLFLFLQKDTVFLKSSVVCFFFRLSWSDLGIWDLTPGPAEWALRCSPHTSPLPGSAVCAHLCLRPGLGGSLVLLGQGGVRRRRCAGLKFEQKLFVLWEHKKLIWGREGRTEGRMDRGAVLDRSVRDPRRGHGWP